MVSTKKQSGFTLVELIVSLGVFSVVITVAVGALLMLVAANEQLQGEQSVMTNLSFALDSMTRELRTGTDYYCDARPNKSGANNIFDDGNNMDTIIESITLGETQDCENGNSSNRRLQGVAFVEGGDSITGAASRILFFYDEDDGKLYRRVGAGDAIPITSSGLYIHNAEFFVTGSHPISNAPSPPRLEDTNQASVTILIDASPTSTTPAAEWVTVQTTVSQRTLDI